MQPVAAQPRAMIPPPLVPRAATMEDLIRHKPTKFTGKSTLDEADAWLRECDKIFMVIACTEDNRWEMQNTGGWECSSRCKPGRR